MQLKVVDSEKFGAKGTSGEIKLEDLLKRARNLGAEKAKIIDTDTQKETYGKWNYFALVLLE